MEEEAADMETIAVVAVVEEVVGKLPPEVNLGTSPSSIHSIQLSPLLYIFQIYGKVYIF